LQGLEDKIRNQQVVSSILTAGLRNKKALGFFQVLFFVSGMGDRLDN